MISLFLALIFDKFISPMRSIASLVGLAGEIETKHEQIISTCCFDRRDDLISSRTPLWQASEPTGLVRVRGGTGAATATAAIAER